MDIPLLAKRDRVTGATRTIAEHMCAAAEAAADLYDHWLPDGVHKRLPHKVLCVFLVAAHDLGKASPVFQEHIKGYGFNFPRHWNISHEILRRAGFDLSICAVMSAHHGKPPDEESISNLKAGHHNEACGFLDPDYLNAQEALLSYAAELADIDGQELEDFKKTRLTLPEQMLLAGFVIMADWISSAKDQGEEVAPPPSWRSVGNAHEDVYRKRFAIEQPRPVQRAVLELFEEVNAPGLMIIEAPMGEGKTESALAAAELMAERSGRGGMMFALPTQATSNAMFARVLDWTRRLDLEQPHTMDLLHGRKLANAQYRTLDIHGDGDGHVMVHGWLRGRKRAILADFVIGTVDHVLMTSLKQKHVMLRHLGLANKVVIIDECHAYDAYMDVYLCRALEWLGAYKVPVVILSATLTALKRSELINAYLGSKETRTLSCAYPLITYTDGQKVRELEVPASGRRVSVEIGQVDGDEQMMDRLGALLANGGCAGVIVNTVKRAQSLYDQLQGRFPDTRILLSHARFTARDRAEREEELIRLLGKPGRSQRPRRLIVIGTQVLEQSLDIDFDVMISELCPMDLLIQRIGRLHRHTRPRPKGLERAICLVANADNGSTAVYGTYLLERTRALLPEEMTLPDDIAPLVNEAYDGSDGEGKEEHEQRITEKQSKAKAFLLRKPKGDWLVGLLDRLVGDTDHHGEAAVRDGNDALEVVLIENEENGLELGLIERMMRSVKLPARFSHSKVIDKAIKELERVCPNDEGDLFLRLDERNEAAVCGHKLRYTKVKGLEEYE